jgi:hypothetical protein
LLLLLVTLAVSLISVAALSAPGYHASVVNYLVRRIHMISLEHVARPKVYIESVEPTYDHKTQQLCPGSDKRTLYMKSSTRFDGESDKGGDDE